VALRTHRADGVVAPVSRAACFLRVLELLAAAAVDRDLLIVIDDVHWADRSTLDVISFLSRRLVGTGVLLVLAYRSDELSRRHPLKPVLADLERHATLDHIRLARRASPRHEPDRGILGSESTEEP
jgi:predicted ATPase